MNKQHSHIKITNPNGMVSFVAFNQDTYNRLNDQNKNLIPERKKKIETLDITEEEIQKQSGYDETAALEMNPVAANLISKSQYQDKRIAELEAALEASHKETKEIKDSALNADEKVKTKK